MASEDSRKKENQMTVLSKLSDKQEESTEKKQDKALVCSVTHTAVKG